jgi:hypothetical protein
MRGPYGLAAAIHAAVIRHWGSFADAELGGWHDASALAVGGIGMTPLPALTIAGTLAAAAAFALVLDMVKVPFFPLQIT